MDEVTLARSIHIVCVVLWIGGVAMVTTVLLPAVRSFKEPKDRVAFFEKVESRFAWQARVTTFVTGLSGLYMLYTLNAWDRYLDPAEYWWVYAMTAIWLIFTLMLFIFEPLFLHDLFVKKATKAPESTFKTIQTMHWVLLTISLITVMGAVHGAH